MKTLLNKFCLLLQLIFIFLPETEKVAFIFLSIYIYFMNSFSFKIFFHPF